MRGQHRSVASEQQDYQDNDVEPVERARFLSQYDSINPPIGMKSVVVVASILGTPLPLTPSTYNSTERLHLCTYGWQFAICISI